VVFPNAFSPNGDGINDIFTFKSRYITSTTMKIYNRWGELVFQTSDADQGWDGTVNGKAAPLGTYIHYTQLTDDMGITFIKSGEIVLIR
jgi:gliding motility-associated-like protein